MNNFVQGLMRTKPISVSSTQDMAANISIARDSLLSQGEKSYVFYMLKFTKRVGVGVMDFENASEGGFRTFKPSKKGRQWLPNISRELLTTI